MVKVTISNNCEDASALDGELTFGAVCKPQGENEVGISLFIVGESIGNLSDLIANVACQLVIKAIERKSAIETAGALSELTLSVKQETEDYIKAHAELFGKELQERLDRIGERKTYGPISPDDVDF